MTRNLIDEETAERNRAEGEGGYTFNSMPDRDYDGPMFVLAVLRLGDHAHIEFSTGRQVSQPAAIRPSWHYGRAGHLIMAWEDWLVFRSIIEDDGRFRIAEVERPSQGQLEHHMAGKP